MHVVMHSLTLFPEFAWLNWLLELGCKQGICRQPSGGQAKPRHNLNMAEKRYSRLLLGLFFLLLLFIGHVRWIDCILFLIKIFQIKIKNYSGSTAQF